MFNELIIFFLFFNLKSLLKKIVPSNQNETLDTDRITCFEYLVKKFFYLVL
jgi:hypothetical protein